MNRRRFIKTGSAIGAGSLIFPGLLSDGTLQASAYKLNHKPNPKTWSNNDVTVAWLGHSTILINFYGKWIITDPVLYERVGVYLLGTTVGPSRLTPAALKITEIPKPDLVLLSHGHMDHTDYPTLKAITELYPDQIDVVTAYLTGDITDELPWRSMTVLDWNQHTKVNDVKVTAIEVAHFGWRYPWEKDRSRGYFKDGRSYNAYLIELGGTQLLFGGDTRNTDLFNILQGENVEVAMMPIGAYNPWRHAHCNPEEALQMT
ncbi:MAG: MBL fold metallo-hydrolase, partial [Melioribacteraceae bacterium]|nr:MBL fold metallo-hydrolase [Melioribacteraceae bacterium]